MQWQDEIKTMAGFTEAELQDPRLWELMVMSARACLDLIEDRIEFPRKGLTEEQNATANTECEAVVKTIKTWFRSKGQIDD
jgi:hypothetical protein